MNAQHYNEAAAWTCRQTALSPGRRTMHAVDEASRWVSSAGATQVVTPVQAFVPGVVAHYLTHQDLPITKELAVLFVDLADSTRLVVQQPPAQALHLIQRFTETVTDIALAYCGDVKDYEGDGALLYFASIAHATQAALAMGRRSPHGQRATGMSFRRASASTSERSQLASSALRRDARSRLSVRP